MDTHNRINLIRERLNAAFSPSLLSIKDESSKHIGHAGNATGMGHYAIQIASTQFSSKKLVDCHRLIYSALGDLLGTEIHALKINIQRAELLQTANHALEENEKY